MNLLSNLPANLPEELTTVLQEGHGGRIERIVSKGHPSPSPCAAVVFLWNETSPHKSPSPPSP
jgi:hypothetical protein